MYRIYLKKALLLFLTLAVVGCGWKPEVTPEAITAPWSEMKLPLEHDAIVFTSKPEEFRAVHKGKDLAAIATPYVETLKAQGWTMSDYKAGDEVTADFKKGAEAISLRSYFFDGSSTAVVLEKKA